MKSPQVIKVIGRAMPKKQFMIALATLAVVITGLSVFTVLNRDTSTSTSTKPTQQVQNDGKVTGDGTTLPSAAQADAQSKPTTTNDKPATTGQTKAPASPQTSTKSTTTASSNSSSTKATAPYVQPALVITALTVNGNFVNSPGCSDSSGFPYTYDLSFNAGKGPITISSKWEYEMLGPGQFTPDINPTLQGTPVSTGAVRMYNTSPYDAKVYIYSNAAGSYRARLHVLTPNSIYSNWITIPQAVPCH